MIEGEDGVTHINIYSKGKTELGKWLSNFAFTPMDIPEYGNFNSGEAFWYYLLSGDESLRGWSGYNAKLKGIQSTGQKNNWSEEKIKLMMDTKLKTYPEKMRELAESTLPLTHYYQYGTKRVDAGYNWITEHWELRREQLKKHFGI